MHVLVLGAGVIGLTSAYALARDGHRVTVIDRHPQVASETSFANGGQLSYSYVAPFAAPGVLVQALGWLLMPGAPLRFRPGLDAHQWRWCAAFVRAANRATFESSIVALLELADYSRLLMNEWVARERLEFGRRRAGKLVVYRHPRSLRAASAWLELQAAQGAQARAVGVDELVAIEPAMRDAAPSLAGGIYSPADEVGDCHAFCLELQRRLSAAPFEVQWSLGTQVHGLTIRGTCVTGVETTHGVIGADAVVVALGAGARPLLLPHGIDLPIYPLTGYSLTLPVNDDAAAPHVSVTDQQLKTLYARLGPCVRVAAMVDIGGRTDRINRQRLAHLIEQATRMLPRAGDFARAEVWMGHRPASPDGKPLIGATAMRQLFVNLGHGALGFTLAAGSAMLLAHAVAGRRAPVSVEPYRHPALGAP